MIYDFLLKMYIHIHSSQKIVYILTPDDLLREPSGNKRAIMFIL